MKKNVKVIVTLVLGCSISVFAQTNMSSDSSMKNAQMSGKKMSMSGCIAEKDGKYMIMNKEHPDGVQLMGSQDMKPHVGHMVKVTGMMENMDTASGGSMKSGDNMSDDKMKHDGMGMGMMKVSSMKMMFDHCDMSSMNK